MEFVLYEAFRQLSIVIFILRNHYN